MSPCHPVTLSPCQPVTMCFPAHRATKRGTRQSAAKYHKPAFAPPGDIAGGGGINIHSRRLPQRPHRATAPPSQLAAPKLRTSQDFTRKTPPARPPINLPPAMGKANLMAHTTQRTKTTEWRTKNNLPHQTSGSSSSEPDQQSSPVQPSQCNQISYLTIRNRNKNMHNKKKNKSQN
jgi:hypothetical protein